MKVFSKNNDLWNKSLNTIKLYKSNFIIPQTFIIWNDFFNNSNFSFLIDDKKYILRPSFDLEDSKILSYAWYFKSIFPLNREEIIKIFQLKNFENLFNWKNHILKSIIIQEFIETDSYWVYFSRNPDNILKKWFYEIWEKNDDITSWRNINKKLNFLKVKELEIIWKKIENIFWFPADIEFCIKNNEIIILQTRPITSWNNTIYNFWEIKKINWVYEILDFDEIKNPDYFMFEILKWIFDILYLDNKIYFKKHFFSTYLFKKIRKSKFKIFYKKYKKYLFFKSLFNIIKIFIFQKLDKNTLKSFFSNYNYSFNLKEKSNINLSFDYKTNFITKLFLNIEKLKNNAFIELENLKKEYNNIKKLPENKFWLDNKIIFLNWIIINKKNDLTKWNIWIYKGKINWKITDLKSFEYKKNLNQILILNDLDFELYNKLEFIDGLIIKNWNLLSHNSIILREFKIPSIIKYENFNDLIVWESVII